MELKSIKSEKSINKSSIDTLNNDLSLKISKKSKEIKRISHGNSLLDDNVSETFTEFSKKKINQESERRSVRYDFSPSKKMLFIAIPLPLGNSRNSSGSQKLFNKSNNFKKVPESPDNLRLTENNEILNKKDSISHLKQNIDHVGDIANVKENDSFLSDASNSITVLKENWVNKNDVEKKRKDSQSNFSSRFDNYIQYEMLPNYRKADYEEIMVKKSKEGINMGKNAEKKELVNKDNIVININADKKKQVQPHPFNNKHNFTKLKQEKELKFILVCDCINEENNSKPKNFSQQKGKNSKKETYKRTELNKANCGASKFSSKNNTGLQKENTNFDRKITDELNKLPRDEAALAEAILKLFKNMNVKDQKEFQKILSSRKPKLKLIQDCKYSKR